MRPEDIIADVLHRDGLKSSPDEVARKIIDALEQDGLYLHQPEGLPCPMCGGC